jgi:hypothetical protein
MRNLSWGLSLTLNSLSNVQPLPRGSYARKGKVRRVFTSETGRKARCRKAGLAAARYWRKSGFKNLELAREVRRRNVERRRELGLISPAWAKRLRSKGIPVG